jgi:hypothetical protein
VDLQLGVEDEERAAGYPVVALQVGAADAPGINRFALEVCDQLEGQTPQLAGERAVRVDTVDADAEDADTLGLEILVVVPKLGKLVPSTRREVKHVEGDHRGPVAPDRLREPDRRPAGRRQLEVGRDVSDFQHFRKKDYRRR